MKRFVKYSYILIFGIVIGTVLAYLLLSKDKELKNNVEKSSNTNNTEEVELGDTATYFDSINVHYDNTSSGLTNNTVKEAIDELYGNLLLKECAIGYNKQNAATFSYECKALCRAVKNTSDLHTETCSYTSGSYYCYADGYSDSGSKGTTTITYGTIWDGVSALKAGDAFDCDVNGNEMIDTDSNGKSTERFYYVSPYFNTDDQTFDDTTGYATLIYYRNYKNGSPSDAGVPYYSSASENWHGPVTAATHLPTTTSWSNISLKETSRAILAENRTYHNSPTVTYVGTTHTLPTAFSYEGKAARLITAQEIMRGCGLTQVGTNTTGEIRGCNFLFERTQYAKSSSSLTPGPWLETPKQHSEYTFYASGSMRCVADYLANNDDYGARPTIDVKYSNLLY